MKGTSHLEVNNAYSAHAKIRCVGHLPDLWLAPVVIFGSLLTNPPTNLALITVALESQEMQLLHCG